MIHRKAKYQDTFTMKARFKLILGRRKNYPLNIELEVYKGIDCRVFIPTGVMLDSAKQWDANHQLIVRHDYAAPYNAMLNNMIKNIERVELEVENRGGVVTKDIIRKASVNTTSVDEINAFDKFSEYISKGKLKDPTIVTYMNHLATLHRYVDLLKGTKASKLYFREITLAFISDFNKFMQLSLAASTIFGANITIRNCISTAVKDGYMKTSPYDYYPLTEPKQEQKPSLTKEQLTLLESITRDQLRDLASNENQLKKYECALDRFLFSCYTGLRISDNSSLLKSDVSHDTNGLVIQKIMQKTNEIVTLPLHILFDGKPQTIALKYLEDGSDRETLFPMVHVNNLRARLRKVFQLVGLPDSVTFHTARHTCASILAEKVDNPFVIKDVLGHCDINTSMRYISKSHKAAEKKLRHISWSADGSEPEHNIMEICQSLKDVCGSAGLSAAHTMVVLGALMKDMGKYDLIRVWLESREVASMTLRELNDKLQSLIATNE